MLRSGARNFTQGSHLDTGARIFGTYCVEFPKPLAGIWGKSEIPWTKTDVAHTWDAGIQVMSLLPMPQDQTLNAIFQQVYTLETSSYHFSFFWTQLLFATSGTSVTLIFEYEGKGYGTDMFLQWAENKHLSGSVHCTPTWHPTSSTQHRSR